MINYYYIYMFIFNLIFIDVQHQIYINFYEIIYVKICSNVKRIFNLVKPYFVSLFAIFL